MFDEDTPIYREVAEAWAAGRYPVRGTEPLGRHRWVAEPATVPIPAQGDANYEERHRCDVVRPKRA